MACGVEKYLGFDPNNSLRNSHKRMIEMFGGGDEQRFQVIYLPFQSYEFEDKQSFDLVFTSPPFFDFEIYSNEKTQSIQSFPKFNDWIVQFLFVSLTKSWEQLEIGGHLVIHLNDTSSIRICEILCLFCVSQLENCLLHGLLPSESARNPNKLVSIWVFKKIASMNEFQRESKKRSTQIFKSQHKKIFQFSTNFFKKKRNQNMHPKTKQNKKPKN